MNAAAELGRIPVSKYQIQSEYLNEQADAGRDLPNLFRDIQFSGANEDWEVFVFPVQLTTSRIGNLTRLILTRAIYVMTIHPYIQYLTVWNSGASPADVYRCSNCIQNNQP